MQSYLRGIASNLGMVIDISLRRLYPAGNLRVEYGSSVVRVLISKQ